MGTYDTPEMITAIIDVTGFDKVNVVGHSEGTTQLMAGGTLLPDFYNKHINVAILLAPPASLKNTQITLMRLMAEPLNRELMTTLVEKIGFYNLMPYNYL